jgi:hypothetical protein
LFFGVDCRFIQPNISELAAMKARSKQYKKFVEEQRRRAERNENLLRMLDRVDFQAASLAAKSERLKILKVSWFTKIDCFMKRVHAHAQSID